MKNIIIAGVGGQGTLLASTILGHLALIQELDVKLSEVHGMSQRGGSVVTYVRIGDKDEKVFSPLIDMGQADALIAFELLEGLRWLSFLKKESGVAYINKQRILPMPVITGVCKYPDNIEKQIIELFPNSVFIDALNLAKAAGSQKCVNTVLLGVFSIYTDYSSEIWEEAITASVKLKFKDMNLQAFRLGRDAAASL